MIKGLTGAKYFKGESYYSYTQLIDVYYIIIPMNVQKVHYLFTIKRILLYTKYIERIVLLRKEHFKCFVIQTTIMTVSYPFWRKAITLI